MNLEIGNFVANAGGAVIGLLVAALGWHISGTGGGFLMAVYGLMAVICSFCVIAQLIWWASLAMRRPGK